MAEITRFLPANKFRKGLESWETFKDRLARDLMEIFLFRIPIGSVIDHAKVYLLRGGLQAEAFNLNRRSIITRVTQQHLDHRRKINDNNKKRGEIFPRAYELAAIFSALLCAARYEEVSRKWLHKSCFYDTRHKETDIKLFFILFSQILLRRLLEVGFLPASPHVRNLFWVRWGRLAGEILIKIPNDLAVCWSLRRRKIYRSVSM